MSKVSFELEDKEQASYEAFVEECDKLFGEDEGSYSFEFYPNSIGVAVTVKFHHKTLKKPLIRDITDMDSW